MSLQPRDEPLLEYLARYYLLAPQQIRRLCYADASDRVTRRRCDALCRERYVHRHPKADTAGRRPVFYLGDRGADWLAARYGDDRYLAKPTTLLCRGDHVDHTLAVGEFLHVLYSAVERQSTVTMPACFHEFEPVNPADTDARWRRMRTEFDRATGKLVCMPDAGFLMERDGSRVAYYLERETGLGAGFKDVARRKWKGYAELAARALHNDHFPTTTWHRFFVLFVCPDGRWRDGLIRQLAKVLPERQRDEASFWRAIAIDDAVPEKLLFEPIVRRADQPELASLLTPPSEKPSASPAQLSIAAGT